MNKGNICATNYKMPTYENIMNDHMLVMFSYLDRIMIWNDLSLFILAENTLSISKLHCVKTHSQ